MKLYIVATPIGNMQDITERARQTLAEVDLIAAEDTRHSAVLLQYLGITTPLIAYHDHNEQTASEGLIDRILAGTTVALISDAGTPLISDPGYRLVQLAHERGVQVIPIPGPSALLAAVSVSGIPTDRFLFIGFLPSKAEARRRTLEELKSETATLVFYESRHRISQSVQSMVEQFGGDRMAFIGRELTKKFEQGRYATLADLQAQIESGEITAKGEFVVVVSGAAESTSDYEHLPLMKALLEELPPRKAAGIAAKLTGMSKKALYELALSLKGDKKD